MPWIAPDLIRVDEPIAASEREMLKGFPDWGRGTLLVKCAACDQQTMGSADHEIGSP